MPLRTPILQQRDVILTYLEHTRRIPNKPLTLKPQLRVPAYEISSHTLMTFSMDALIHKYIFLFPVS